MERNRKIFSEWLEKLQQESWQLELLISGFALFGIWEASDWLHYLDYQKDVYAVGKLQVFLDGFLMILKFSWMIFFVNLLVHIIVRGLWIGAVGLRYVSGDIDFDELNYSTTFTRYYKRKIGSFDDYIERLERLSSVLFSYTFLLFFIFLSLILTVLLFMAVMFTGEIVLKDFSNSVRIFSGVIFGMVFFGLGFIVFIDFITLGSLKKVEYPVFSKIYLRIYQFFSFISLSFLFRPLLLNFIDNKYTKRLFFLAFPYLLVMLFSKGFYFEKYSYIPSVNNDTQCDYCVEENTIHWNKYDDLRAEHFETYHTEGDRIEKKKIHYASLGKFENDEDYGKLFLEYRASDDELIKLMYGIKYGYRTKGFRHEIMSSSNITKDSNVVALEEERLDLIKLMRQVVRNIKKGPDLELKERFPDKFEYFSSKTKEDESELRSEIMRGYNEQIFSYNQKRLQDIMNAQKSFSEVIIDGAIWNDSLECKYFTHPNMHERGLLCYFPTRSLKPGSHMLNIERTYFNDNVKDSTSTRRIVIPFRMK